MNQAQLRNSLWEATYNAEFFRRQSDLWEAIQWTLKVFLTLGTASGFIPLLRGGENFGWASWVSIASGLFGIIGLPLLGIGRCIEVSHARRMMWTDQRTRLLKALNCYNEKGKLMPRMQDEIEEHDRDIDRDTRAAFHLPCQRWAVKQAEKVFRGFEV